jgi:hypothetical protein
MNAAMLRILRLKVYKKNQGISDMAEIVNGEKL